MPEGGVALDISNHWITLSSIIVGVGLTEMLGNLQRLVRERRRVRWDPLPLVWAGVMLLVVLNYWWAMVAGLDGSGKADTVAQFAVLLASPILLFLMCCNVLPRIEPGGDGDMRAGWHAGRKVFALAFALYQVSNWLVAVFMVGGPWTDVSTLRAIVLALVLSVLFTDSRRWDWIVAGLTIGLLLVRLFTQQLR